MREITRVIQATAAQPGLIGPGHATLQVVNPTDFARNDPFVSLTDDRIDVGPGPRLGEAPAPAPARLELATFVVDGEIRHHDAGVLRKGDIAWTTAGGGAIPDEEVEPLGPARILQLWMTAPSEPRGAVPRFAHVPADRVPERKGPGTRVRVLSGRSSDVVSPPHTHLPLLMLDIHMAARSSFTQEIPTTHHGFVYVLDAQVTVSGTLLKAGEVGWFGDAGHEDVDMVSIAAGPIGGRAILCMGDGATG